MRHSAGSDKTGGPVLLLQSAPALSYIAVHTALVQIQVLTAVHCTVLNWAVQARREVALVGYLSRVLAGVSVQLSLAQYIFIHEVVREGVVAGQTSLPRHAVQAFLRSTQSDSAPPLVLCCGVLKFTVDCTVQTPVWQPLEKQFSVSTETVPASHQYLTAANPANHLMNNRSDTRWFGG